MTLAVALALFNIPDFAGARGGSWVVSCLQVAAGISAGVSPSLLRKGASERELAIEQPAS